MNKRKKHEKCYNCENHGASREHIIPKFFLDKGEDGFFIPCCENCRNSLKWLDDYAADYFRFMNSPNSFGKWDKWYKQAIIQNGSPFALRLFGEDVVIDEDLLMRFIQKLCVGITYKLYGQLDNSYRINIFTNFSKLGGFSQYNAPNIMSYTEEQTIKIIESRNNFLNHFYQFLRQHETISYEIKNVKIKSTENHAVHGALWFTVELYEKYKIICAVVDGVSTQFANTRNMIYASFPINIDTIELNQHREKVKQIKHGDSILTNLSYSAISDESRTLRKTELESLGVPSSDIEIFEKSLSDVMLNKGGRERLAKMFSEALKGRYKL